MQLNAPFPSLKLSLARCCRLLPANCQSLQNLSLRPTECRNVAPGCHLLAPVCMPSCSSTRSGTPAGLASNWAGAISAGLPRGGGCRLANALLPARLQSQISLTKSEQDYVKDAGQQLQAICHQYLGSITGSALPSWATSFAGQMVVEAIAGSMPLKSSCLVSKPPPCCSGGHCIPDIAVLGRPTSLLLCVFHALFFCCGCSLCVVS